MAKDITIRILAKDATRAAFSKIRKSTNTLKNVFFSLKGVIAAALSTKVFMDAAAQIDNLAKTSAKLGLSVEWLQKMQYAAQLSGVEIRTFNMAMQRFTRRAAEAAAGTGEAKAALEQMGIQLTDSNGRLRPVEALLGEVSNALSGVESQSEKVKLAFKLFDSEGVAMINMLGQGEEALNNVAGEFESLGVTIDKTATEDVEQMNDSFTKMGTVVDGVVNRMVAWAAPEIGSFADWVTNVMVAAAQDSGRAWDLFYYAFLAGMYKNLGAIESFAVGSMNVIISQVEYVLNAMMDYGRYAVNWLIRTYNYFASKLGMDQWQTLSAANTKISMGRMETTDYWQKQEAAAWGKTQDIASTVGQATGEAQREQQTHVNNITVERIVLEDGTTVIAGYG